MCRCSTLSSQGGTTGKACYWCWLPLRLVRSLVVVILIVVRTWLIVRICVLAEVVPVLVFGCGGFFIFVWHFFFAAVSGWWWGQ